MGKKEILIIKFFSHLLNEKLRVTCPKDMANM